MTKQKLSSFDHIYNKINPFDLIGPEGRPEI